MVFRGLMGMVVAVLLASCVCDEDRTAALPVSKEEACIEWAAAFCDAASDCATDESWGRCWQIAHVTCCDNGAPCKSPFRMEPSDWDACMQETQAQACDMPDVQQFPDNCAPLL